ncbi:PREDICTED: uncharacterized protein LOC107532108 isoform X2 [Miniopterus natalensis]|uniref:uncharacterized protein LOC107532108 isoform X2 n=1 Tax=Miniopterus natalensis TaxID=291302 RepID=UPI0007A6F855|nr:PREDICTED: uncharacterized protein LOC107532108 isoform X2 [Miniopterus natalensis]
MLAEIVKHFHPRLVDLHNYVPTCNTDQKLSNWSILNRKVFHKLRFCVSEADIRKVVANTPGAIEPILCLLREKVVDGAVCEDPPNAAVLGRAIDPGVSSADANGLWMGLTTTPHAGLPSLPVPSGVKTLQTEQAVEKMGHCACRGRDPSRGALGAPGPWGAAAARGKRAGAGHSAGDCQGFADEGGQAGAPGEAEGPAD